VPDAASRRAAGFALGEHHDAQLADGALVMAVRGGQVPVVIMHAGQGSEYTAGLFRAACERTGIRQSMGRPDKRWITCGRPSYFDQDAGCQPGPQGVQAIRVFRK
jgi:transposase InsO family protein